MNFGFCSDTFVSLGFVCRLELGTYWLGTLWLIGKLRLIWKLKYDLLECNIFVVQASGDIAV